VIGARIVEHHAGWTGPWLEHEIFGKHDPEAVAAALEAFVGGSVDECLAL
jgi:hypothetical protein